jgi:isochorismate synthase EntC
VAGSRSRALGDESRDLQLAAELTASAKDGLENAIVVDFVTDKFDRLAKRGIIEKTGKRGASNVEILALSNVQHLRCVLTAQLAPLMLKRLQNARARRRRPWWPLLTFFASRGSAPRHLLEALHPTPATAGLPVEASKREIEKAEPFDRGW